VSLHRSSSEKVAAASIAPAETIVWTKCTLSRVWLLLDSQTGQLVNTDQLVNKVGQIWSKSQRLVKGEGFNYKY